MTLDIHFPYSHSLKEKRQQINSIRGRIQKKYNISFAEVDYQDKWQRSKIGIVSVNNKKTIIENLFQRIINDIELNIDGDILQSNISFI